MTLIETFRLAHRNFAAARTRSLAAIITIGILFSLLLTLFLIFQGAENIATRYCVAANPSHIDTPSSVGPSATSTPDNAAPGTPLARLKLYFSQKRHAFRPITIILLITSTLILTFTMAHLLSQNVKIFAIYRAVGASKLQIFAIYFTYLLELCLYATLFAIILSFLLAGLTTIISWDYLSTKLHDFYPTSPTFPPILIGWSWQYLLTTLCLILTSPVAFLLCLDQFSTKKITLKLKGE